VLCGVVNGFLVTVVGLPSLAVTIGTLALFRGIAVGLLGTTAITDFPEFWTDLAKANIPGTPIPVITIPFVILAIIFAVLLHFTPFGRSLYAIGLNKEAAQFSGIDVGRTKFILFVLSGAVSGFAGVYFTLLYSNARGDNAMGMELQVIAAVLLGGVSIFGGRGALHGVIAGVLLIGTLGSALRLAGVTSDIINVITGVLLILSVVSASFLAWLQARRSAAVGKKKGRAGTSPDGS
jgi:rhamnose transport system permease protein